MDKISEFKNEYHFLSNFENSTIFIGKENIEIYPTVEHAYQASKSLDPFVRKTIADLPTPHIAKRYGRQIKIREDWEDIKIQVMYDLLKFKFTFYSALRDSLLRTGDAILEEGNTWEDKYWGVCPPNSGIGQNNLGKLLMLVRSEIRNG